MAPPCLELVGVRKQFGGVLALKDVSFSVEERRIVSVIGPNGAGKTTLFNLITSVLPCTAGRIVFRGREIGGFPPHGIAALGVGRTFQNLGLFRDMTVLENVLVGFHCRRREGLLGVALGAPGVRRREAALVVEARRALERVRLDGRADLLAGHLPYGDQKLLELARALAMRPALLLLDEPGAGLDRAEKDDLVQLILEVHAEGVTVLLVEHHMDIVMRISDRIVVLNFGEKIAEGTPEEVRENPDVVAAYLGDGEAHAVR